MKKRETKILKELLRELQRFVIYSRVGSNDTHSICNKIDVISELIDRWEQQKWVAGVDLYNECRYDCEPVRLEAA